MEQLTSGQLAFLIGAMIFAIIFFIGVAWTIARVFKRLERLDKEETAKYQDTNDPNLDGSTPQ